MHIDLLDEPQLEFGGTGRHVDIRFGLMQFGPLDAEDQDAPKEIRLGIVGTAETVEGISEWLDRCAEGIAARESSQPCLFPRFPGCGEGRPLGCVITTESRVQRTISRQELDTICSSIDRNSVVKAASEWVTSECRYLADSTTCDVIACALPWDIVGAVDEAESAGPPAGPGDGGEAEQGALDLHDLVKARAMPFNRPVQVVLPSTYNVSAPRRPAGRARRLQDEATRAWNMYVALYYKAGGRPWRILKEASDYTTCYVGVSFYKSLDEERVETAVAQVFSERGEGIIVRGGASAQHQGGSPASS